MHGIESLDWSVSLHQKPAYIDDYIKSLGLFLRVWLKYTHYELSLLVQEVGKCRLT